MKRWAVFSRWALVLACIAPAAEVRAGGLCYVKADAAGPNNGASWTDAYTDLQSALHDASCTQVWVAYGVYKPTSGTDQTISFNVRPGVAVYGGFAATETALGQRTSAVIAAHPSVLSGDIDNNDAYRATTNVDATAADIAGNNSYHVVYMDGTTAQGAITFTTVLDGFTITGGNANNTISWPQYVGGGLYCDGEDNGYKCSPTLTNITFSGNSAQNGGAMFNLGPRDGASSPTLTNVTFSGNSAYYAGGAMYNDGSGGGVSSPMLTNVTFSGNSAFYGGAMFNVGEAGGTSSPTLSNVTFSSNNAPYGGAMFNIGEEGNSSPTLTNVILWNNSAFVSGPEIHNVSATPTIRYSIVQGGCPSGSSCDSTDLLNDASSNPKLGSLADNGGSMQTLLPGAGSAAIDAGVCASAADAPLSITLPATDQRGIARPQGTHCDIGAIEMQQYPLTVEVTGSGMVNSTTLAIPATSDGIVACTGTCSAAYAEGTQIELAFTPAAGWNVASVTTASCGAAGSAGIATYTTDALSSACTVSVTFTPVLMRPGRRDIKMYAPQRSAR